MPIQEKCRVLDHQKIGLQYYKLTLVSPYIASHAQPGQFVNVKCSASSDPLLRRPISLHQIYKERGTFELLYEAVGKGTERMAKHCVGEEIDILGPLGNGFKFDSHKKIAVLVGGGMGVAPLLCLAEQISNNKSQMTNKVVYVLIGAKNKEHVFEEAAFRKITDQVLVSTDDGSYGKKGGITDQLLDYLDNQLSVISYPLSVIYACGPRPMLKVVAEIAFQKKIDCQLSLEERMACGLGACKGCAVMTKSGYKMVCKDGPVFNSQEILWN